MLKVGKLSYLKLSHNSNKGMLGVQQVCWGYFRECQVYFRVCWGYAVGYFSIKVPSAIGWCAGHLLVSKQKLAYDKHPWWYESEQECGMWYCNGIFADNIYNYTGDRLMAQLEDTRSSTCSSQLWFGTLWQYIISSLLAAWSGGVTLVGGQWVTGLLYTQHWVTPGHGLQSLVGEPPSLSLSPSGENGVVVSVTIMSLGHCH